MTQVGVIILTYNEAPNIERTLSKLGWAKRILVVDSGSTDGTVEIAGKHLNVEVVHRPFDSFADQCNFGLSRVGTPWVLSLDADYELSDALVSELLSLTPAPGIAGYRAHFIYRVHGRPLRGTLYPPRVVLYRRDGAAYENVGHSHRIKMVGAVIPLRAPIYHDDRKSLRRWFESQRCYAQAEARHLLSAPRSELSKVDRIRLLAGPAPFLALIYTLFIKRCLVDGRTGWFYAMQRMLAEVLIALELLEQRIRRV